MQKQIIGKYPASLLKKPAPQGNNFPCLLSLYITHPSFGHQFQLLSWCQVYFQVSTFLLCHCIFAFSCNVLALSLLALPAALNVKCLWGPERVFRFIYFIFFLIHIFLPFVLAQLLHQFTQEKLLLLKRGVEKYLRRPWVI